MRQDSAGWLDLHTRTELIIGKHLVSDDLDLHQLVTRTRIHNVDDPQRILIRAWALLKGHFRVEVSPRLHEMQQIAPALIAQVVLKRILLVNRNTAFEDGMCALV